MREVSLIAEPTSRKLRYVLQPALIGACNTICLSELYVEWGGIYTGCTGKFLTDVWELVAAVCTATYLHPLCPPLIVPERGQHSNSDFNILVTSGQAANELCRGECKHTMLLRRRLFLAARLAKRSSFLLLMTVVRDMVFLCFCKAGPFLGARDIFPAGQHKTVTSINII